MVVVLVETADDVRGRFLADSVNEAIKELANRFPVGAKVADRLRRGERIVNDAYTLAICWDSTVPPKSRTDLF